MILFLFACADTQAPVPAPPAPAVAPPAPSHEAAPHEHEAPHGGEVKTVGSVHLEAKFLPEGLLVWVTDKDEKALDTSAYAGATAVIMGEGAPQTVSFSPMGEHLHATAKLAHGAKASAVVTITVDGKAESVSFSTPAVGMAEHEHTSLHGGVVGMWGEHHVEYAPKDGEYRFFMSDAKRQSVTTGVSGTVKDGDTVIPLELDAASGMLHAKGAGAGSRPVTLDAKVGEVAFQLGFAAATADAGGGHDHGAGHDHASHGH